MVCFLFWIAYRYLKHHGAKPLSRFAWWFNHCVTLLIYIQNSRYSTSVILKKEEHFVAVKVKLGNSKFSLSSTLQKLKCKKSLIYSAEEDMWEFSTVTLKRIRRGHWKHFLTEIFTQVITEYVNFFHKSVTHLLDSIQHHQFGRWR